MSEMREGTPEWALAFMEDAARHTLLDEGSGTRELRRAVKIIQAALSQARADALAQGRRQGLEEAAKVADGRAYGFAAHPGWGEHSIPASECRGIARSIRSLATAPTETQKPEETA